MLWKLPVGELLSPSNSEILKVATEAIRVAGEIVIGVRERGMLDIRNKAARDMVTTADLQAEAAIISIIKRHFPTHEFLAEEAASAKELNTQLGKGPLWIIDPVDGTTNFAYGHPQVGISIGFALNGSVQAGAVFAPFQRELFTAIKGKGAKLNGEPIGVSRTESLADALVCTGFPYVRDNVPRLMKLSSQVLQNCRDLRRLGAASLDLCWVGAGRLDAYYETVLPWDMAAGRLIAQEAGATCGNFMPYSPDDPTPIDLRCDGLLVATPAVFEPLKELLVRSWKS